MATLRIKFFDDIQTLKEYYKALSKEYGKYVAVSSHTPLLSNLNIIENIALIEEVHKRYNRKISHQNALHKLSQFNMQSLATKQASQCNELEKFTLILIRASMMQNVTIVIITPLAQYQTQGSLDYLIEAMQTLKIEERTIILDLSLYKNDYKEKGLSCHIIA